MTIREGVLQLDPRSLARLVDLIRAREGTYSDFVERVRVIFTNAGRTPPEARELDALLVEADTLEYR